MAKRHISIVIILAMTLLASVTQAQQAGLEQEAEDRQLEASELLSDLNSRNWEEQDAMDSLGQANDEFDQGMDYYNNMEWQNAIDSFNDAIYLGGEAIAYEEGGDVIDDLDLGIPWAEVDIEGIGQGVRSSDFPILMGLIFISVFVILPVTYKLV